MDTKTIIIIALIGFFILVLGTECYFGYCKGGYCSKQQGLNCNPNFLCEDGTIYDNTTGQNIPTSGGC